MNRYELLKEISAYGFTAYELQLFLDTHPNDQKALSLFHDACEKGKELEMVYAEQYGPLRPCQSSRTVPFSWIKEPWPWQGVMGAESNMKGAVSPATDYNMKNSMLSPEMGMKNSMLSPEMGMKNSMLSPEMGMKNSMLSPEMGMKNGMLSPEMGMKNSMLSPETGMKNSMLSPEMGMKNSMLSPATEQNKKNGMVSPYTTNGENPPRPAPFVIFKERMM